MANYPQLTSAMPAPISPVQEALNRLSNEQDVLTAKLSALTERLHSALRQVPPAPNSPSPIRECAGTPLGEQILMLHERLTSASDIVQSLIDRVEL